MLKGSVGYYNIRILRNFGNMKKFIVIVALSLLSLGAWAQYSGDVVERSGRYLKVNGEKTQVVRVSVHKYLGHSFYT